MKKIIVFTLLAMIMVGCNVRSENGSVYVTTIIDSCEYIISGSLVNHGNITHKGNCRFCLERNKRMVKEQIDSALIQKFD